MSVDVKKVVFDYLTLGGIVTVPAAATFTGVFFLTYYTEKEIVHLMRKRKFILPVILGLTAGGFVAMFGSKLLAPLIKPG
jgi:hypothetical protein